LTSLIKGFFTTVRTNQSHIELCRWYSIEDPREIKDYLFQWKCQFL